MLVNRMRDSLTFKLSIAFALSEYENLIPSTIQAFFSRSVIILSFCGHTTLTEIPYFIVARSLILRGISVALHTTYMHSTVPKSRRTHKYEPIHIVAIRVRSYRSLPTLSSTITVARFP